ncbi:MAG: hypothetical protein JKY65_33215 [Planctomycetes bacterium]|nr:hypothetical protein [Planctomycetota bacterium]
MAETDGAATKISTARSRRTYAVVGARILLHERRITAVGLVIVAVLLLAGALLQNVAAQT